MRDKIKQVNELVRKDGVYIKNVDKDKKSFGVTVIFQPKLQSFSDQQLEEFSKKIILNNRNIKKFFKRWYY